MAPQPAPLGEWASPITSEMITASTIRLSAPSLVHNSGHLALFWLEGRPTEAGRGVLVQHTL